MRGGANNMPRRDPDAWREIAFRRAGRPDRRTPRQDTTADAQSESSRYTPKRGQVRFRPRWHRFAGWLGLIVGVLDLIMNDAMLLTGLTLLPFGHKEAWLLVGIVVAGLSTRLLGLLDRGTAVYR